MITAYFEPHDTRPDVTVELSLDQINLVNDLLDFIDFEATIVLDFDAETALRILELVNEYPDLSYELWEVLGELLINDPRFFEEAQKDAGSLMFDGYPVDSDF
jgi:hypothetical protein